MQNKVNTFSLLLKPVSSDCNLNCSYCFYLEKSKLYPKSKIHRMPGNVSEKLINSYLKTDQNQYVFIWQGGEPLLAGLDFYNRVIKLQQKYGKPGALITNVIQTNATLIDNDWARFFKEYNFLLGVSIDGTEDLHNIYRRNNSTGSYDNVIKGIEILHKNSVDFNALIAVHNRNVDKPKEILSHLTDLGIYYHQYIPIVEFDKNNSPEEWTISGNKWSRFLIELFDEWQSKYLRKVSIRIFDAIINYLVSGQKNICSWDKNCQNYFVVEYNGDIYPCDFFVENAYKLGNITENRWNDIQKSKILKEFCSLKCDLHQYCRTCKYMDLCMGDCPKYRQNNKSYLCNGWKLFFDHSLTKFDKIIKTHIH